MNGGNGTVSASESLAVRLLERGAGAAVTDLMAEANPLGAMLAEVYNFLLGRDLRWASLYMELAHRFPFDGFGPANALSRGRTLRLIERRRPDAVVLICPWIVGPVLGALRRLSGPRPKVYVVVVDLGTGLAPSWFNPGVDFTTLPTRQAQRWLREHGLDGHPSEVTGMPLSPAVLEQGAPPACLDGLSGPVVAVLGGREGGRNTLAIADRLLERHLDASIVVQCGKNRALLRAASRRKGVRAVGFLDSLIPLMRASSVVVTKPGALTVSELVALRKPFVLDTWPAVMPQERGNVQFVREERCGLIASRPEDIPPMVESALDGRRSFSYPEIYGTDRIADIILKGGAP
jgi:processive 1,2-diacylglycerol beta-glucosyltransferase